MEFSSTARRLGVYSALATVVLLVAYATALAIGLLTLKSPDDPVGDPWFTTIEVLIIIMMPAIVALMVAVHTWAPSHLKPLSLVAVVFMGLVAGVTCIVHFSVLTLSHQSIFAGQQWKALVFDFTWPSVVYSLDILAWDVFFPLSMLFAAFVFSGDRLASWLRLTMLLSAALSFAGLLGVVTGNMQLRNIGIVGYVPVFAVVGVMLAMLFARTVAAEGRAVRGSKVLQMESGG